MGPGIGALLDQTLELQFEYALARTVSWTHLLRGSAWAEMAEGLPQKSRNPGLAQHSWGGGSLKVT